MIDTAQNVGAEAQPHSDFTVPTGCITCGGELAVRISPGRAFAYCGKCHWLSRPVVEAVPDGFRVGPTIVHFA